MCEDDFVRVFLPGNGIELGGPESKQAWLRVILRGWSWIELIRITLTLSLVTRETRYVKKSVTNKVKNIDFHMARIQCLHSALPFVLS